MPKPILNNRINKASIGGIVSTFDTFVDQAVTSNSSPTFGNLCISGDTLINGNLYVEGNTTVIESLVSKFNDNIILLNNNELGAGVTLLQAGIEIDRGSSENYRMIYNESSSTFRVGPISSTKPVAIREENPLTGGIMVWNNSNKILESVNSLNVGISILDSTNATSVTSGSLWTKGGMGVSKDLYINGQINIDGCVLKSTTNSLRVTSPGDISFNPSGIISIPNDISLIFGSTNQSMSYNSGLGNLKIRSGGSITYDFVTNSDHYISIPNGIPLTFSTSSEKIYADGSNNMVINGSKDILLNPGSSYKVVIPLNTSLAFINGNQTISANVSGDISIVSGNNIFLNPNVSGGYIRIPTDNKLKLGGTGNQSISSDSNNNLNISSNNNINISSSNVILSNTCNLGWDFAKLYVTSGNLVINSGTSGNVVVGNTHGTNALQVYGGLNVNKQITCNQTFLLNSTSGSFTVTSNGDNTSGAILNIDLSKSDPNLVINGNAANLLEIKSMNNTVGDYYIGRSSDSSGGNRNFNINIPSYNEYSNVGDRPKFSITTDSSNTKLLEVDTDSGDLNIYGSLILNDTSGSLEIAGDFISNNIYASGRITCITDNTSAVLVNSTGSETSGTLLNIDTINKDISVDCNQLNINNLLSVKDSIINSTSVSLVITNDGTTNINKELKINGHTEINNTIDLKNNYIINVPDPIDTNDVANKAYVDLVKQGLYVKDSVKVGTTEHRNLTTGFVSGVVIDDYTLVTGDRILIKDQNNSIENGIYIIKTSGSPLRSDDLGIGDHAGGSFMFIENGTVNANSGWICNTTLSDIVGTDPITFTQFNGVGLLVAGSAITKNVNTINVKVDDYSIEVDSISNSLRSSSKGVGTGLIGGSGSQLETSTDQSHINKVGTIISGTWNGSNIGVPYGGTGNTQFNKGTVIYGNDSGNLLSDDAFVYDEENRRLGLGINIPQSNLHISSVDSSIITIEANSDNSNPNGYPQVLFQNNNKDIGSITISRNADDFYEGHYADAMIISNNYTSGGLSGSGGSIQLSTNKLSRMTILRNGYIGINTTAPTSVLDVNGQVTISDELLLNGTLNLNNTSASSFSFSGSGGIDGRLRLNNQDIATSTGGALLVSGGVNVSKNMIIGDSLRVDGNTVLNKIILNSVTTGSGVGGMGVINYMQTPDSGFTSLSFNPMHVIRYTDYNNPIISLLESGIKLNKDSTLNIGGNPGVDGGYTFKFDTTLGNLHITPYNTSVTNGCFIIGTNGNLSDIKLLGNNSDVYWDSKNDTLKVNDAIISLINTKNNPKHIFKIKTPDNNGKTIMEAVNANGDFTNGNLNIQMYTAFSNVSGGGLVSYNPGNTSSSFTFGEDVSVTFSGNTIFNGTLQIGNGENVVLNNTAGNSSWIYLGVLSNTQFIVYDTSSSYNLHVGVSLDGSQLSTNSYDNNIPDNGIYPIVYMYNDNVSNYHGFIKIPQNTSISLNVINNDIKFSYSSEGTDLLPNGTNSSFNNGTWSLVYDTTQSNSNNHLGDVYTQNLLVGKNIPIISYNNTEGSKDIGIALKRYQYENDSLIGDVINDSSVLSMTLPSQVTMDLNRLKLNGGSLVDNYYKDWWVKCNNQVRKVISYSGFQEIITLNSDWTIKPVSGDVVYFYNNNYICSYYNETDKKLSFVYTAKETTDVSNVIVNEYIDIKTKDIYSNNIVATGALTITNTSDNTNRTDGGSLTVLGGASINKTLLVGNKIGVNDTNFFVPDESIHIKNSNRNTSILLENNNTNGSYASSIILKNPINYYKFSLNNVSKSLEVSNSNGTFLTFNSYGNIGVGTSTSNSLLTLAAGHLICADNSNSYIGLNSGNSDNTNDGNAQIILNGSGSSHGGNVDIYIGGTDGSLNILNGTNGNILFNTNNNGTINIFNTTSSTIESGSLLLNGGLTIKTTSNSASITSGGGMTVMGGMSIIKDVYIGGKVFIEGELNASGAVSQPSITFNNTVNCTIIETGNINLMRFSSQGILVFYINVTPTISRDYCSFRFNLPDRVSNLNTRGECVVNVSGWSNDTDIIPLCNVIGVGISGTKSCLVKFTSNNTDIHYLTVQCIYTI